MNLKIFSGSSNIPLTKKICGYLPYGQKMGDVLLKTFPSGEKYCQFQENIRGSDVFLIQSLSSPVNDNLMELLIMCDAARRASAGRITITIPYMGYARQERKDKSRTPISARLIMDLFKASGVNRVLTMDLHAPQIVGFTNLPVDHLTFRPALLGELKNMNLEIDSVVSPDIGAVKRSEEYANALKKDLVIISKKRNDETSVSVKQFIGDVKGKKVIIIDDLTESAGTLIESATSCQEQGASEIYCAISHGCFTELGYRRLIKSFNSGLINKLFVSNSVNFDINNFYREDYFEDTTSFVNFSDKVIVVDISPWFSSAIHNINNNESVSELFY